MSTATAERLVDMPEYAALVARWKNATLAYEQADKELSAEWEARNRAARESTRDTNARAIAEGRLAPADLTVSHIETPADLVERRATFFNAMGKAKAALDAFIHDESSRRLAALSPERRESYEDIISALEALRDAQARQRSMLEELQAGGVVALHWDFCYEAVPEGSIEQHIGTIHRIISHLPVATPKSRR